ncbi:hypothetical protein DPEC_G00110920 [Dallia pectoralis]|uniref:Uncharacterized protein n=1 Tax=Dallia pectoralis TaxID=75939 RepID=A0ACC2GTD2_DALPE|nr:hypothetical protein DPEC_G00110920 [Dallia pectoralis]
MRSPPSPDPPRWHDARSINRLARRGAEGGASRKGEEPSESWGVEGPAEPSEFKVTVHIEQGCPACARKGFWLQLI